jgi:hypothetical protein
MAVTINASTSAGLVNTADTSGILQLQTANTTAVTVNASQNVTFAGSITPSQTNGIVGTTTNNSVAAGSVGEYISSEVAAAGSVSMTGGNVNITSISLTAGDWDVTAIAKGNTASNVTISWVRCSISPSSAVYDDSHSFANESSQTSNNIGAPAFGIPPKRYSLSTTTTLYLTFQAGIAVGTIGGYGRLSARRIR